MNVYDTANRLASEIKQSEEYMNYKMAKQALNLNTKLKEKMMEFEQTRYEVQLEMMQTGKNNEEKYKKFETKKYQIQQLINLLQSNKITPIKETNDYLESIGSTKLLDGITLYDLLKRPEITIDTLRNFIEIDYTDEVIEQVEIQVKYEGYIKKANSEAEKMLDLEKVKIPEDINYDNVHNLASEARQKLTTIRPTTIAQASRISGVNPADISILMVYLKKEKRI